MDLDALLAQVLQELERSADPGRRALGQRLREGTHTAQDTSDLADLIEDAALGTRN